MSTLGLNISDGPGKLPVATMLQHFEAMVRDTALFRKRLRLNPVMMEGRFVHYLDPATDDLWTGFALGMRMAERIGKAAAQAAQNTGLEEGE